MIEFTEEQVRRLDEMGAEQKASREELVGKAVDAYLGRVVIPPELSDAFGEPREWPELDAVFGILKDEGEDTFALLRRVRGE